MKLKKILRTIQATKDIEQIFFPKEKKIRFVYFPFLRIKKKVNLILECA